MVLSYAYLYLCGGWGADDSNLMNWIAKVDLSCLVITAICAVVVMLVVNDKCLDRYGTKIDRNLSIVVFVVAIIFHICASSAWRRYPRVLFKKVSRYLRGAQEQSGDSIMESSRSSIFVRALNRFFDRWMLVVIFLICRYTDTEYEVVKSTKSGILVIIPAALRCFAILGLVDDAYKIFTGKIDGYEIKGDTDSRGVQSFAKLWATSWVGQTAVVSLVFFYYGTLIWFFRSEDEQKNSLRYYVIEHGSVFVRFCLDLTSLASIMGIVQVLQQHELEIMKFAHRLVGKFENASYAVTHKNLHKLFDVLKMMMAVQFFNLLVTSSSIFHIAFDVYNTHPITLVTLYIFGIATPFLYTFFSLIASTENVTIETRDYTVWALFYSSVACAALIGAFRGCSPDDSYPQFLVYFARSNAMPTSFGFGMCFLSSPAAARFSPAWHTLPLPFRLLLAPMPWLSTHLMQQIHIASGAVFFFPGFYHTIAWLVIIASGMVTTFTAKLLFTVPTGVLLVALGTKLIWPPGMVGISSRFPSLARLDNFLKDSKYGSFHVYFVKFCFFLYIFHASVRQYPRRIFYWGFPLIGYVILIFLHPAKSTYYHSNWFQIFQHQDSFCRSYITLSKNSVSIRDRTLASVTLILKTPTYDEQLGDIMYSGQSEYRGFCDVILIKFRQKDSPYAREVETVHYYSTVGIKNKACEEGHQIEAQLMIQKTGRKGGCSDALMSTSEDSASSIEVKCIQLLFIISFNNIISFISGPGLSKIECYGVRVYTWNHCIRLGKRCCSVLFYFQASKIAPDTSQYAQCDL